MTRPKALFLDRDGVINVDHAYVFKPDNFEFIDGIFELCKVAKRHGYLIFVITNQAGIGRGYYTEQEFLELTDWMCQTFLRQDVDIAKVYYCPFHPDYGIGKYKMNTPNRKPGPGMLQQAKAEFQLDLASSILVGDKETDIEAGIAAGVGCNLLYVAAGLAETRATAIVKRLSDVTNFFG